MSNNLAAVARHNQLEAAVLAARTPAEQLKAERALRDSLMPGHDESGNFTVARAEGNPLRPDATGNFTVARKPA